MHALVSSANVGAQENRTEESIQIWLVEQISCLAGILPGQIEITEPFALYGIDSVGSAGLSGELANWLGVKLPPTIVWDYPTIKLLARYLATNLPERCAVEA
jgi:acyl carrier protein